MDFYLKKIFTFFKTYKKYFIAFGGLVLLLISLQLFYYSYSENDVNQEYDDYFNIDNQTFNIRIPKKLQFAGEKIPVNNIHVRESIARELIANTYWKTRTTILHQRANRWFKIIEPILKKNDIPEDFKYIALVESQLTNVVSPQGATGFWQIIEPTGKQYGLEITAEVDERYNVVKSTEVACKYFKEAYKIFNNWTLVAASYNLGIGGIQVQLNKQNTDSYYNLILNRETARYVYRILAMKEIIARPRVYGFMLRKRDFGSGPATKKITVDTTITNLSDFAISQKINYNVLQLFNPWLRSNTLSNENNKKYMIEIPQGNIAIYDLVEKEIKLDSLMVKKDSIHLNDTIPNSTIIQH